MGVDEIIGDKRGRLLDLARKHGVDSVRVFGSAARGDADQDSDVDLLIEAKGAVPAWFPGGLVADLEELLGRSVSVVEADALKQDVRDNVLAEAVSL